ncbi:ZC21A protein, partial [Acromyrmex insinuator]
MDADAPSPILFPCAICARTFTSQSLEKHTRICERAAAKKRKPFDSAKQRIQGTELAEFQPKQEIRRHQQDERSRSTWKKTHDDFLRTIREARGDVMDSRNQCNSLISSGAPTRANEKGTCPTCNRQFGIKAYDRHVAWCKDRVIRMPVSPATNLAKERLEARMRYRAPTLKNRRAINREKYSPGSAANQAAKVSLSSPALVKPKETISSVSCNRESPVKQKPAIMRRPGQLKDSPPSSGPIKSRLADRMNRPLEDHDCPLTSTSCRSLHPVIPSRHSPHLPVPPTRSKINDLVSSNEIISPITSSRKRFNQNETISQRIPNDDTRNRETYSARIQNIVSARSQGHPRINNLAVNDKTLGITVQPCRIHMNMQKDDQLVTWKQISRKKDNFQADDPIINHNFSREYQLLDLDQLRNRENQNKDKTEGDLSIIANNFIQTHKDCKVDKVKNDDITWFSGIQNLNQTYLIKDSEDIESSKIFYSKWKPIKHSPRVEFYLKDKEEICEFDKKESEKKTEIVADNLKDREDEICKFDQKKSKRETIANDLKDRENEICEFDQRKLEREIVADLKDREDEICKFDQKKSKRKIIANDEKIKIEEVKECIKNKEDDKITVDRKVEELKTNNKSIKNIRKINSEKIEVVAHTMEKLNINSIEENKRIGSYEETEVTENNIEKIEINISVREGIKETEKINGTDIAELNKLNVHKENKKDRQIIMNEIITESMKCTKEIEQNLSESDQLIKSSLFDVVHSTASNVSKKKNFIDQSQDCLNSKDEVQQCENNTRCNNSLELKKSIATFTCDQRKINEITSLNTSNNQTDCNSSPENEMSARQSHNCRNSLDLTENIKEVSFSVSSPILTPEKNCTRNVEEIKIDEERYENSLINICNKKSKGNSKKLKREVYSLPQNSEIAADNYLNASTNNISLHVKNNRQFQEKDFRSDNIGNIENNTKNGKLDFNTDSDNSCSNDKSSLLGRSIIKTEITTGEGLRKKNVDSEFDYGSDNTVLVEEYNRRGADGLGSSVTLTDYAEEQSRRRDSEIFLNAGVNFPKRACGAAKRASREQSVNSIEMKHRIRESMNLFRGSTDSLISSVEFVELTSIRRPKANCTYEQETIEVIRPNRRHKVFKNLPDIKDDAAETKEDSEGSYWEKTSKISRSRLTSLYPTCHTEYKLTKRNPRVRILPPVLNPFLINGRKIELETRPAWCNYVRRRPDFNLVLKARTGICKDYDPFLLAEQQMNDLLSDTSDQSMTGSPKVQQTRDTLYPLSHSSAFVKYPPTDKRSSLIAPPTEFDDLLSNFSSDSTETNSISREVFLKPNLTGKDATDSATSKPVRELGRRVIIDKSKALGVDERRGVVSADRPRKIFDKDTLRNTGSLINRSNSIRASSAPRINSGSDRKTLGDIRKGSKKVESQRSSDQSLNQRNNNYSSLSGSNLSLNSIVSSSELDVKRSNSMFDELMTSFEEDTFPGLKSFLNNESFDLSSPGGDRQRNGSLISDEELSSPDSYKPQDHSKLSNDSAYSSLNRKYSHHGRSTNDVIDRLDEDVPGNGTSPIQTMTKCKMSKFCHECGQRFPETAKFCCECGVKRLAL